MLTYFFSVKASIIGAKSFSNDDEVYSLVFQQAYRRSLRSSQLGLLYQSKTAVSLYFDLITIKTQNSFFASHSNLYNLVAICFIITLTILFLLSHTNRNHCVISGFCLHCYFDAIIIIKYIFC